MFGNFVSPCSSYKRFGTNDEIFNHENDFGHDGCFDLRVIHAELGRG